MNNTPPWEPLDEPQWERPQAGQRPPWEPQWQPQQPNHQPPYGGQQPVPHAPWGGPDQQPSPQPYAGQPWPSQQAAGPEAPTQVSPGSPNGHRARPPKKRHRKRNIILATIGVFLIIGAIGDALGAGKTPPPKPAAASRPATTPKAAVTTTPAPAATTAPAQVSTAQAVVSWYENGGHSGLNQIVAAENNVAQQAGAENFSGAAQACAGLATAVSNEEANGPIPDRRAEKWFAKALSKYDTAAAECQAGASTQNVSALIQAANDMNMGTTDLDKVTDVIKTLSGE
jgi:hypothetical protein